MNSGPPGVAARPADLHGEGLPPVFWLYMAAAALVAAGFADFSLIAFHFERARVVEPALIPVFYAVAMGAGGLVGAGCCARVTRFDREKDRNFNCAEIASGLRAQFFEGRQVLDQAIGRDGQRAPSVAESSRVPERAQVVGRDAAGSDMNRRMRLLARLGEAFDRGEMHELALEG